MEELDEIESYRHTIITSALLLRKIHSDVLTRIVNIAMNGEYSDLNAVIDVGDEIPMDIDYFRNCNDVNIQSLLKLIEELDKTHEFLVNVNNITEDEMELTSDLE